MLLGSLYAGMSFANSPVGAVHALAYPVGCWGVPHGLCNSLLLPRVLEYNAPTASKLYAELAPICFSSINEGTDSQKVDQFIDQISQLSKSLELPQRLSEVGIEAKDCDFMASEAMKQTRLLPNNPREVTQADAFQIYSEIV